MAESGLDGSDQTGMSQIGWRVTCAQVEGTGEVMPISDHLFGWQKFRP